MILKSVDYYTLKYIFV